MTPLLKAEALTVHYTHRVGTARRTVHAVDGVDLEIHRGETLGLVGESGCGKSTVGRALIGATTPTSGSVVFDGITTTGANRRQWRELRRRMQMVFQDPYSALNPKLTIHRILTEPLVVQGCRSATVLDSEVTRLLDMVGLPRSAAHKHPHAFSGGQRQRIVIARALALRPDFVVADEPTAALDVSIQSQIVNLMTDLQKEHGLSYLFISHNLAVVKHVSNRVMVMYLGRVVEVGDVASVYGAPVHPYTKALLDAVPVPDPTVRKERRPLSGDIPSAIDPPTGCTFNTRCPLAIGKCFTDRPPLTNRGPGHRVACWVC